MSEYTWRELERADMDAAASHAAEMEYRAEQIANEAQKRLARAEHIVNGLGDVNGEIVRCRDCKHYMDYEYEYEPNLGYCREHDREEVRDSGFCAWAERR